MANEHLDFKTLDFELSRLEGSSILDDKVKQATRDAAYFLREMRNLCRADHTCTVADIIRRMEMRVNNPQEFAKMYEAECNG